MSDEDRQTDQGYSWLVMAAAFLSHLINGSFTMGIIAVLTYVWTIEFKISSETSAWASVVMFGFLFLTGPVIAVLIKAIGAWKTQLFGVILSITGFIITAFSVQFWHVILGFSVITNLGFAMMLLATNDIISLYFDKYRDKIYSAIVVCLFIGLAVAPSVVERLIAMITYKNTMFCLASLSVLNLPSAFIYRRFLCGSRLTCVKKNAVVPYGETKSNISSQMFNGAKSDTEVKPSDIVPPECQVRNSTDFILETTGGEIGAMIDINSNVKTTLTQSEMELATKSSGNAYEEMQEIKMVKSETSSDSLVQEVKGSPGADKGETKTTHQLALLRGLKKAVPVLSKHLTILKHPLFILYIVVYFFHGLGANSFYSLTVDYIVNKGVLPLPQAALGMTLTGVSTVVGALAFTILLNWTFDRSVFLILGEFLVGLGMILLPIATNMATVYTLLILFGIGDAIMLVIILPLVSQKFPNDGEGNTVRFSYVMFFYGIGAIAGPPIVMKISSVANMDAAFYFMGSCSLFATGIIFAYWLVNKIKKR